MFSVGIIGFMGLDENGLSRDILCNRLVLAEVVEGWLRAEQRVSRRGALQSIFVRIAFRGYTCEPNTVHSRFERALIKMELSKDDIERVNFVWSIYDSTNEGVDAFYLGDLLRALEMNPTLATIEKMGGTKKKGEKKLMVDEFYPIFAQVIKDKDQGVYEDFIECLKLYDKAEDGHMIGGELTHILLSLGEKLSDAELDEVVKDCMDNEDEDGMIPYVPFVKKVMVRLSDMK
ncbi:hypothetical protein QTP88_017049 [Uroleucon formosanum]